MIWQSWTREILACSQEVQEVSAYVKKTNRSSDVTCGEKYLGQIVFNEILKNDISNHCTTDNLVCCFNNENLNLLYRTLNTFNIVSTKYTHTKLCQQYFPPSHILPNNTLLLVSLVILFSNHQASVIANCKPLAHPFFLHHGGTPKYQRTGSNHHRYTCHGSVLCCHLQYSGSVWRQPYCSGNP